MALKLTRAPGGAGPIVLDPKVWNDLCGAVERFDAIADKVDLVTHISAAPPLSVSSNEIGIRLSIADVGPAWPVKVVEANGAGVYAAKRGQWKQTTFNPGVGLSLASITDFDNAVDCFLWNQGESDIASHRIGADTIVIAWYTPMPTDATYPVYGTIYNHAVRFIRQNPLTLDFEFTDKDGAAAGAIADADWVVWATAQRCTTTPTATLMQLMNPGSYQ